MEVPCRLWGLGLVHKAPGLWPPPSAVVFFRGTSCHPAVWLLVSHEGTCLPGCWIHRAACHTQALSTLSEKRHLAFSTTGWRRGGRPANPGPQICHLVPPLCSLQFSAQGWKQLLSPPFVPHHDSALGTVPVPWRGGNHQ